MTLVAPEDGGRLDGSRPLFIVLAPTRSTNALGRAIALSLVAAELGEVRLMAPDSAHQWPAVHQFGVPVERLSSPEALAICIRGEKRQVVVWASKGFGGIHRYLAYLRQATGAQIWFDQDDDDVGLARDYRKSSSLNFLRTLPIRPMSPERLTHNRRHAMAAAHVFTFASHALARRMGLPSSEYIRVPHARLTPHRLPPAREDDGKLRIGFLGTYRPHKGLHLLPQLLGADPEALAVTFDPPPFDLPATARERWIVLGRDCTLAQAYSELDFQILPMSATPASDVQLPAKMVDALAYGVPVAATPTSAIREFLAPGRFLPIADWNDASGVISVLRNAPREELARAGSEVFQRELSAEAVAKVVRPLLMQ